MGHLVFVFGKGSGLDSFFILFSIDLVRYYFGSFGYLLLFWGLGFTFLFLSIGEEMTCIGFCNFWPLDFLGFDSCNVI